MAALTPAVSSDWLAIDSKANVGTGTTPYVPDNSTEAPAKVPYVQTGVPVQNPVVVGVSGEFLSQPQAWTGNWPNVNASQGEFGRQLPVQRGQGAPQGQEYPRAEQPNGYNPRTNAYDNLNQYAGHDAHSQDTDTLGWDQYTLTGRTALRQRFGDSSAGYLGVQQWTPAERPTPSRRALTAQAPIGGQLPPSAYTGPAQNLAYSAPAAPPVATVPPAGTVVDPLAGGWA